MKVIIGMIDMTGVGVNRKVWGGGGYKWSSVFEV